jgi:recombination protein RecA
MPLGAAKLHIASADELARTAHAIPQGTATPLSAPDSSLPHAALAQLLPAGRLIELSGKGGSARSSIAVSLLGEVQALGESCAWIQMKGGGLYAPDLATAGIDLDALVVIQVPQHAGAHALLRSAELLLRSGAFGMVVIDLEAERPSGSPAAWQGRLLGLARQHESRVLFLSRSGAEQTSLGPLIGLRIEARRNKIGKGRFAIESLLLKNKSGAPFEFSPLSVRGPWGLR